MSMKWIGGPNHILRHVLSENPTQIPNTGPPPFGVMVLYGVVVIWLPTTVSIGMKWIWYECEVDGRS